jgi:phosphatidylglycerophosphatase A
MSERRAGHPWQLWIVTLGGAGLLPKMPGTYGSAVTAILLYFTGLSPIVLIAGLVIFGALCVALGGWAQDFLGRKDPGPVVLDEAAGICLTAFFQPYWIHGRIWTLIAVFVSFRIFDITKPPPARQLERLSAGWGILMDDLAAAIYANLACQMVLRFI